MKSILKELYNGRIYPAEQTVPQDEDYRATQRIISDEREYWMEKLTEEEYKCLEEKLLFNQEMLIAIEAEEAYRCGFKMGAMIMAEILEEK